MVYPDDANAASCSKQRCGLGRHTAHGSLVVLAALVLLFAVACGDSDEPGEPATADATDEVETQVEEQDPTPTLAPEVDPDAENDLARALLLTIDDFPSGWTEEPPTEDDNDDTFDDYCPQLQGPAPGRSGIAETGTFSGPSFGQVSQEIALFVDEEAAQAALEQMDDMAECLRDIINAGELDDHEARFFDAAVRVVSFPEFGQRTGAYRISLDIETRDGDTGEMFFDLVAITTGRLSFTLLAADVFSPFPTHTLEDLAARAVEKIESANIPPFGEEADLPTPAPTPEPIGTSRSAPAPVGTAVEVGGWSIVVESVIPDATDQVLAENQFNDPPAEGNQFFVATITATYLGGEEESSSFFADVSLQALGPSAVAYSDHQDRCGVIPNELDSYREVFEGGTISGNICWQIQAGDASDLVMFAEEMFSFENGRWWFALHPVE